MSLFDAIFKNRPKERGEYQGFYKMLNGYRPAFTSWGGSIYESELIRAAIHAKAKHISKLKVETQGAARPRLTSKLKHAPNQFQTWSQFLYRLDTILECLNTAYIVPCYDVYGEPSGIFCVLPSRCEVVQYGGVPYLLRAERTDGLSAGTHALTDAEVSAGHAAVPTSRNATCVKMFVRGEYGVATHRVFF